jgi:2-oxoglutarate dehydrogenase complex dehydrogenase (E1) component-like enzyme
MQRLAYAGRPEAANPAAGSMALHRKQQATLVATAFAGLA